MSTEHERDEDSSDALEQEIPSTEGTGEDLPRRGRRRSRPRGVAWGFFHPPAARWSAPGEDRARSLLGRISERMQASAGLRVAVAVGAVLVMVLVVALGWALTRPGQDAAEPSAEAPASSQASADEPEVQLPGSQADVEADEPGAENSAAEPELSGREADEAALEEINDGDGLVTARDDDADDPMVTGARFLRALRSVDTTSDEVGDWYAARDSFLSEGRTGRQEDWGEAGEQEAVSEAEVSWAEMDAAITDGRGIAPDFPFGPEAEPGTHLVQVGMRLDREVTVDGTTVQTPSGALMEAVVVCPPAEGVDRCVVTDWAEEPTDFVGADDQAWEPGL
ncbi:hypothetical protein [Kocuria sp. SL71]|uniref:hypothetical protein n=1 Tax=Kocuria sp. SL71 TaxID=2995151 RepID=UPI00227382A7|nr:hypothetical protein [Kocuria sp. SL71]MCY1684022.1 hypothetical protein [Kocuria sp. SL71]